MTDTMTVIVPTIITEDFATTMVDQTIGPITVILAMATDTIIIHDTIKKQHG